MKKVSIIDLESTNGGQSAFVIGMMCGATLLFSLSGVLAPLAGATGTGCITGLAAIAYWKSQGIDVDEIN